MSLMSLLLRNSSVPANLIVLSFQRRAHLWLSALVAAVGLTACTDGITEPSRRAVTQQTVGVQPTAPVGRRSELPLQALSRQVPAFGGYYFDAAGNLVVNVTDESVAPTIRGMVQHLLDRPRRGRTPTAGQRELIVKRVAFDFTKLAQWRTALLRAGSEVNGFHSIGISHSRNRIEISVSSPQAYSAMLAVVGRLGVPSHALHVSIEAEQNDFADSLTKYVSAFGAGLRVSGYRFGNSFGPCTLGWNVYTGTAFITASHCTGERGPEPTTSATVFYQPDQMSGAYIGREIMDPSYFSGGDDVNCPVYENVCRYSDAAIIAYPSAVAPGAAGQGRIWATTWASFSASSPGSLRIDVPMTIVGESSQTIEGEVLDKIGASTGWTIGNVIMVCADTRTGGRWWYLCQDRVSAFANFGDSGAPVFRYEGSNTVTMYGLLRGGGEAGGYYTFSPMSAIQMEIGASPAYMY